MPRDSCVQTANNKQHNTIPRFLSLSLSLSRQLFERNEMMQRWKRREKQILHIDKDQSIQVGSAVPTHPSFPFVSAVYIRLVYSQAI